MQEAISLHSYIQPALYGQEAPSKLRDFLNSIYRYYIYSMYFETCRDAGIMDVNGFVTY